MVNVDASEVNGEDERIEYSGKGLLFGGKKWFGRGNG